MHGTMNIKYTRVHIHRRVDYSSNHVHLCVTLNLIMYMTKSF